MTAPDRFLGRAGVYAQARPRYPDALGAWLAERNLLAGGVADVGAGTGLFTRLLLRHAAQVHAVEPNPEMRARLAEELADQAAAGQLTVHDGTSEATGLPEKCVSLVTAAQAAHWFKPEPTVREFRRILRPGGHVLLVWNDWRGEDTPFNVAYGEAVARFTEPGVPQLATRVPEAELPQFMPGGFERVMFENPLPLTRERLHALAASVSYLPSPEDAAYPAMTQALDALFGAYQQGGTVTLAYRTHAFAGRLDTP
ncbi:class I SAM-dependent methyltransferase [Deinococcus metallilatus]|uniref:SAM-dependent methyltransferase n=1 Tax=Deinococcus metallilatus TaxID=1211322 RepID=A0AAJ5K067_9DEIO|nr:class I SAM-dependent methyltransferase [Deinococcus metallilatus]MBB5294160.1 SAM-dependent methyltransferase [Deinococcus metallilatus]QBY08942.1 class I SAM-dependent methyltransferase [Deinococcus metallilatus]RXJ10086.1 class I SAM-dependent methyltransferase [Deinococcus metallilatus]TLK27977.1 class I SAM-dependent methyltransferase [Deinococcus metallilatus]GMA16503.1 methyltransferase type 11 [Deinococcus metallilatus]